MNAVLLVDTGTGPRSVGLADYADAEVERRAASEAHHWIKQLRHLMVDGQPFRRRFTYRGDSLWWFAELYLHKRQVVLNLFRAIHGLERLVERERPLEMQLRSGDAMARHLAREVARQRRIRYRGPAARDAARFHVARMDLRARWLTWTALASRLRLTSAGSRERVPEVAAFVHRAFWRTTSGLPTAESYIGPVLEALEERLSPGGVQYVGVGPGRNFRARRWWHGALPAARRGAVTPIESFAPLGALRDSMRVWRGRHATRVRLWQSPELRAHARIRGCDCWRFVREELAGIALLQWPWSARAMDEAGAALDALRPAVCVTYAEAGGWGRALMLESRRRGIPSAGLQHGFIYRDWLNYLHEEDEMAPDPEHPEDAGFPRPTMTLLYDSYAAGHLQALGRFPAESLEVTGSPRLDELVASAASLPEAALETTRRETGAAPSQTIVTVVTKYREARHVLPALFSATATMPDVHVVVKTHPAETPDVYRDAIGEAGNARVLPAGAPLAPLLRASRAVVTVNSTVALDAAVLGIPALVLGLPNNLSPFVEAGAMAGAGEPGEIGPLLRRILYDEEFRQQLERARSAILSRYGIGSDGGAAARSADAVLRLVHRRAAV